MVEKGGCKQLLVAMARLRQRNSEFDRRSYFRVIVLQRSSQLTGESKFMQREYKLRVANFFYLYKNKAWPYIVVRCVLERPSCRILDRLQLSAWLVTPIAVLASRQLTHPCPQILVGSQPSCRQCLDLIMGAVRRDIAVAITFCPLMCVGSPSSVIF